MNTVNNDIRLSRHFMLSEFLNLKKHPDNLPSVQVVFNLKYGCLHLLEPARLDVGPIIINSGYRNEVYNRQVGGARNSQHLLGQAADIRPKDPRQFSKLVVYRPTTYRQRLAPHLLDSLRPAPPFHTYWVLQVTVLAVLQNCIALHFCGN